TTEKPWYKLNKDYSERNVEVQKITPNSVLNYYKEIIQLRQRMTALTEGGITIIGNDQNVLAYLRHHNDQKVLILLNMSNQPQYLNSECLSQEIEDSDSIMIGMSSTNSHINIPVFGQKFLLQPFEATIFLIVSKSSIFRFLESGESVSLVVGKVSKTSL
ncbi:MAG: alpha-glucosidase C-terminal domain-containing protein, partial [Cyanobacteria bacterium J06659_2]